ncbi:unnamed protein product [Cuscuta campestris]|uniref:Retrotransposon gag domain-containing protein n=1 Tax=Cuscuta campestris TaxID=132261 RepID=A0A484MUV7_9ASTE|nr:unnamed protein product [Cuscuta campestris]
MVQTRSNVPTTSHVGGKENAPGSGNGTGGIGSTPDAVQALFGLGVTTEQLQAAVAALSAMGGNVPGTGAGKAPPGPHAEHAATSQHKGKKTRKSRRRPCKAPAIEERLPYSHLLNICIRKGEKVRDFIVRWEKEARDVHGADDQALVAMFQAALPRGEVRKELRKNPPPTYQETLARAKFIASEEFDDAPDSEAAPAKRAPADSGETAKKRKKKKDYTAGLRTLSAGVYSVGVPVGTGRELALSPLPHVEAYAVSSGAKYCEYHHDASTPSRGPPEERTWRKPTKPVAVATKAMNPEKRHIGRECDDLDEDEAQGYPVGFIHGGNIGGDSVAQRKRWKHMAFVAKVHQAPAPKLGRREQIQFTEKDLPNTPSPHRDALVVKIEINDAIVHRTLVDTGSSVNIMYEKTFQDLGLNRKDLRPVRTPLSGFTGDSIEAEGVIAVLVIVGDGAHKAKLKMEFMVVSINCAHNMILGRPGLEDLECVISSYYLCMKFPTPSGIGVARGDQKLARSCYVRITKKLPRDETLVVHAQEEMRKLEARPKVEPAEEVEEVPLDLQIPERKVKVGASLTTSQRRRLVDVLAAYRVIFAWGPGDMPGVDPKIICHRLAVNPESRPVKHKKRFLSSERREFVSKEVTTLQSIGHIREVKGCRSNIRARHASSGEEPSADHTRMLFPDEGLTFLLGAPPQGKIRAQTIPGRFFRMEVKHSCSALPLKGRAERRPYPDALPG